MKNWLQKRTIGFLVRNLFNSIGEDDILRIVRTVDRYGNEKVVGIYVGERKLTAEEIDSLRASAEEFRESVIWDFLSKEVKYAANERMYKYGKTADDILMGKCCLYVLDVIEKLINRISRL